MDLCFLDEIGDTLFKVLHIEVGEAFEVSVNADAIENVKMDPPSENVTTSVSHFLSRGSSPSVPTNRFEIGGKETFGRDYFMNSLERVHYSAAEALCGVAYGEGLAFLLVTGWIIKL